MPQLLIELFSEEIPARMQKRAEEDLGRMLRERLVARGLTFEVVETFSTPRRLGLCIEDCPEKAADVNEERKGPRVGAPEQAIQGFLKGAGLTSIDEAQIVEDKKGAFYVARIERAGRAIPEIVQEVLPEIVRAFPWPKSMRSGESDLQWVRPLHNICCTFDKRHVKIDVAGVPSEAKTWGHRFHDPHPIIVTSFEKYDGDLRSAKVIPFRAHRRNYIELGIEEECASRGLEWVRDEGLLEEVVGLVEWPRIIFGDMDPAFLDLPGEVIRLSMRTHQKYFAVRDPKTGKLAPHFIAVANVDAKDGGKAIAAGNARVLSARLNDARFFWDADRKTPLFTEERKAKLQKIVFHQKLGSVWDKVERVKALAVELCAVTGADKALVERAAEVCKMDLVTETVGEFPELQGQIGRALYLAQNEALASSSMEEAPRSGGGGAPATAKAAAREAGTSASRGAPSQSPLRGDSSPIKGERGVAVVAAAIEDHYRPLGPNDRVPSDPVAVTLALADKLDTLVGFWAIDEKPTGSSDPYALRRAALGFIRVALDSAVRMDLKALVNSHEVSRRAVEIARQLKARPLRIPYAKSSSGRLDLNMARLLTADQFTFQPWEDISAMKVARDAASLAKLNEAIWFEEPEFEEPEWIGTDEEFVRVSGKSLQDCFRAPDIAPLSWSDELLAFLADRLKVQLRDQGKRHDLVDAVFALGDDDLVRIVARVEALDAFLKTQDGANLLAGYKRAANILAAEEKKGKWSAAEATGAVDAKLLAEPAEKALHAALDSALPKARAAVEREDFAAAMTALSGLRAPVDDFFEKVLVNAEDASLRRNRLLLLARLVEALSAVADFSKIEG